MPTSRCTRPQLELQLLAQLGVQRAERLVEQQHPRAAAPAPGPARPAAAGRRTAGRDGAWRSLPICTRSSASPTRRVVSSLRRLQVPQAERDVVPDRHEREQRVGLEDGVHRAAVRRIAGDVAAVEFDPAGIGLLEAGDHPQRRGLAAARRPQQRDRTPPPGCRGRCPVTAGTPVEGLRQLTSPIVTARHARVTGLRQPTARRTSRSWRRTGRRRRRRAERTAAIAPPSPTAAGTRRHCAA